MPGARCQCWWALALSVDLSELPDSPLELAAAEVEAGASAGRRRTPRCRATSRRCGSIEGEDVARKWLEGHGRQRRPGLRLQRAGPRRDRQGRDRPRARSTTTTSPRRRRRTPTTRSRSTSRRRTSARSSTSRASACWRRASARTRRSRSCARCSRSPSQEYFADCIEGVSAGRGRQAVEGARRRSTRSRRRTSTSRTSATSRAPSTSCGTPARCSGAPGADGHRRLTPGSRGPGALAPVPRPPATRAPGGRRGCLARAVRRRCCSRLGFAVALAAALPALYLIVVVAGDRQLAADAVLHATGARARRAQRRPCRRR